MKKESEHVGKTIANVTLVILALPFLAILLALLLIMLDHAVEEVMDKFTRRIPVICPVDERYVGTRWIANEANAYLDVPAGHERYNYVVVYKKSNETICVEIRLYDNQYAYVDGPERIEEFQWGIQLDEEMAYGHFEWIDPDHFRLYLGGGAAEEAIGPVLTFTRTKIPEEEPDEGDEDLIEEDERQPAN